mmetsp:Transcript_9413/g.40813  ORF Transcript_9413/g.40813 Transcript_9413/m.40813 type:complete len:99 (+) Transcript_9413:307-603(+)|eukprot:CAMPEP_0113956130 /NCGR_PEP_ID=MMETSP0011_2-20120614/1859_1 /TAXON_ID=101924 /ORGANISM="Rhodosorus marinus" /LENGTH=98 /DNA_ID=CAMNT_0000966179 /DNA_START=151 /DNA_END=447 /DNA_ORIENTATION=- /assembly_acc=CAM_ASM_000156
MSHTILLLQPSAEKSSRTWYEYPSIQDMVRGICSLYEKELRSKRRGELSYDTNDLNRFVDSQVDLACLVLSPGAGMYEPRDKAWVKRTCLQQLKRMSG